MFYPLMSMDSTALDGRAQTLTPWKFNFDKIKIGKKMERLAFRLWERDGQKNSAMEDFSFSQRLVAIEIKDIECRLLSRVVKKLSPKKWRIYKGKICSPQDILCKSKQQFLKKIPNGRFIRAIFFLIGPLSHDKSAHSISNNSMLVVHYQLKITCIYIHLYRYFEVSTENTQYENVYCEVMKQLGIFKKCIYIVYIQYVQLNHMYNTTLQYYMHVQYSINR